MNDLPPSSWDVHIHIFDPKNHPYIADTRYTPPARSVQDLVSASLITNYVVVMSGPEGTDSSLTLESIERLQSLGREARGVVVMDVEQMSPKEIQRLNAGGVRSVRFNTRRNGTLLEELFIQTAKSLHAAGVSWSIEAAIFDIKTWHKLIPTLISLNQTFGTIFVADHVFAAQPSDLETSEFLDLLQLIEDGIIAVKISGLDRYGRNPREMVPLVKAVLGRRQGEGGLFGSDWPNVNSTPGSTELMDVDVAQHTAILKEICNSLGQGYWERLMRDNAKRVYA